ncbi:MAG TPA: MnhB domain-containing protein, partial [Methanofastidiosum sp.]|nr:MnhB domain-containing protein [Methanofastidiosum sp.]
MKTSEFEQGRNIIMGVSLFLFSFLVLRTMYIFGNSIIPGMSHLYNLYSGNIAPNIITVILFDFRGYDTLGETFILITAVITTTMVFGWGSLKGYKKKEIPQMTEKSTVIQKLISFPMSMLLVAFGVTVILGGHITPGGGFPGGSVIATGYFLSVVIYGLKKTPFRFTHKFLVNLSTIGA